MLFTLRTHNRSKQNRETFVYTELFRVFTICLGRFSLCPISQLIKWAIYWKKWLYHIWKEQRSRAVLHARSRMRTVGFREKKPCSSGVYLLTMKGLTRMLFRLFSELPCLAFTLWCFRVFQLIQACSVLLKYVIGHIQAAKTQTRLCSLI